MHFQITGLSGAEPPGQHSLPAGIAAVPKGVPPVHPVHLPPEVRLPSPAETAEKKKQAITLRDLLPVIAIIAGVILLIVLIRVLRPGTSDTETTAPSSDVVTEMPSSEPVTEPETVPTEPETTAAAVQQYVTTDTLNVRAEPSTDARILVQLAPGAPVNYVGVHDDFWSIINYDGTDAYVATQYLTESTP